MNKRKYLSKKVRFEVFKRDSFSCQYCGAQSPDSVLHVDHIIPVSKGGDNSITNLVTSCADCNQGKSNRLISDDSAVKRQKKQLDEINKKREQVEMMALWRKELSELDDDMALMVANAINDHFVNRSVSKDGIKTIKKWLKRFDLKLILDSVDAASNQYLHIGSDGSTTIESAEKLFTMVPRIASVKTKYSDDDVRHKIFYMRGILRNRLRYINERKAIELLTKAHELGESIEYLQEACKDAKNWTDFNMEMECLIEDLINSKVTP